MRRYRGAWYRASSKGLIFTGRTQTLAPNEGLRSERVNKAESDAIQGHTLLKICQWTQAKKPPPKAAQPRTAGRLRASSSGFQSPVRRQEYARADLRIAHLLDDAVGELLQRQDLLGDPGVDDSLWHAVDHAGVLVLGPHHRALAFEHAAALAAVGAHAG